MSPDKTKEPNCPQCSFRAKYDRNPKSFLGRIWKWHIKWCSGWKSYIISLPDEEREELLAKYGSPKKLIQKSS